MLCVDGNAMMIVSSTGAIGLWACGIKSTAAETPKVAERSRLYNDLIAEVNGFRRHFFLRRKMDPKEAYRQHRRKQEEESSRGEFGCPHHPRHRHHLHFTTIATTVAIRCFMFPCSPSLR